MREKNSLEQPKTRNENSFFELVRKNIASGTNLTSTMIDGDNLNDYFANIGKSLASDSKFLQFGRYDYTHICKENYISLSNRYKRCL